MNFTSNSPNQTSSPCPLAMNLKLIRMNVRNLRKPWSVAVKKRQVLGNNFKALRNHRKMIQMYQLQTCQAILARKFPFTIYRNLCLCGDRFQYSSCHPPVTVNANLHPTKLQSSCDGHCSFEWDLPWHTRNTTFLTPPLFHWSHQVALYSGSWSIASEVWMSLVVLKPQKPRGSHRCPATLGRVATASQGGGAAIFPANFWAIRCCGVCFVLVGEENSSGMWWCHPSGKKKRDFTRGWYM